MGKAVCLHRIVSNYADVFHVSITLCCVATSAGSRCFSIAMAIVQTKQDLIGRLRHHRDDLSRLGVRRIGLFGSFQRGEPDPESNVDLLVEFVPGEKSFDNFMAISFFLEDAARSSSFSRAGIANVFPSAGGKEAWRVCIDFRLGASTERTDTLGYRLSLAWPRRAWPEQLGAYLLGPVLERARRRDERVPRDQLAQWHR